MNGLTIGRLAKQAGLGIETIRFYERQGLIQPPPRTDSNYRIYPEEEVARLKFIKRAKDLGFTLKEIKELLFMQHDPHDPVLRGRVRNGPAFIILNYECLLYIVTREWFLKGQGVLWTC